MDSLTENEFQNTADSLLEALSKRVAEMAVLATFEGKPAAPVPTQSDST